MTRTHQTPSAKASADGRNAVANSRSLLAQEYYDKLAAEFHANDEYWSNPYDSATWDMDNELIARHLQRADPLLDLGVGFYPHIESTKGRVLVNLDVSLGSVRVARDVYHQRNPKMQYVGADALLLPFRNEAFAGVVAGGELINHVPSDQLVSEISRVLQPGGRAIISVGMKWCVDSFYALVDSLTGHHIGYSMTKAEAWQFIRQPHHATAVTWEVTPDFNLTVDLSTRHELLGLLAKYGLRLKDIRALNTISAVIPLPVQQSERPNGVVRALTTVLLRLDSAVLGRLPGVRWFSGNVYLVVERG